MSSYAYTEEIYGKFGLDSFCKNWFSENGTWAGDYSISIEVEKVVHRHKSKYQDVLVFDSKKFGRCLSLDNALQATERDEFAYHEVMAHVPLNSHPDPRKVLIVGGGDGGIAREASKHPSVQTIVQCEIDEAVIRASKEYLPFLSKGFDSPKVNLFVGDGVEFLRGKRNEFDVIITDSPDPIGPAAQLFEKPYFELLKGALRPGGVIATQGEVFWFDRFRLKEYLDDVRSVFPVVDYATAFLASSPGGHAGFLLAGVSKNTNFRKPVRTFSLQTLKDMELRYYTPDVHRAAFALPISILKELGLPEEFFLY